MSHFKHIFGISIVVSILVLMRISCWLPWFPSVSESRAEEVRAPREMPPPENSLAIWDDPGEVVTKYDRHIMAAAHTYNIDPCLVKAIIHAESRFDPRALSPRGAMGLMQISPDIARELNVSEFYHPKKNIYAGVKYFRSLLDLFDGSYVLAVAAYNAGSNSVYASRGVPPFQETRLFVSRVFQYFNYYRQNGWG